MATESEVSRKDIRDAISLLCEQTESKYVNLFNDRTLSNLDRPMGKERYIIATGSYAFGQWQPGDDVHLVIMAKASRALLWELIAEKLSLPPTILPTSSTIEISARTLARTTSLQPSVFGRFEVLSSKTMGSCKFYLQYCSIPASFHPTVSAEFKSYDAQYDPPRSPDLVSNLNLVIDMQLLAKKIPSFGAVRFYREHNELRLWAEKQGVLSTRLRFLDSECITWVVYNHFCSADSSTTIQEVTAGVSETYISDLDGDIVSLPQGLSLSKDILRQLKSLIIDNHARGDIYHDKINIVTPTGRLVSGHIPPENVIAIQAALKHGKGFDAFTLHYKHFLKIEFASWEANPALLADFHNSYIPSAMKGFMSDLHHQLANDKEFSGLYARLWADPVGENDTITYLIGLGRSPSARLHSEKDIDHFTGMAMLHLAELAQVMRRPATARVSTRVVSREALRASLQVPKGDSAAQAAAAPTQPIQPVGEATVTTGRFRTAAKAISRLRHDPAHVGIEYDLGYEDRFAGLVWVGLEDWGGRATEEEDFVPEHRIRLLKRRQDQVVVWDRENRVDRTGL